MKFTLIIFFASTSYYIIFCAEIYIFQGFYEICIIKRMVDVPSISKIPQYPSFLKKEALCCKASNFILS